ncbi:M23 family metallopeptidase [Alkanindiges hydrocarboniclasticus]|jgi:murein DD-endopeptidase MepM/ murein hydrolase activator NlpD|uniref:M23 family metallopeptidase n=1 Tax=Alkanindiges hydrocarboniclasticus TaxID=1907941 RepID=UPI0009F994D7|nr:M23 family metallopeptidase [Alkanindiges hydrocarboniclasticus]
MKDHVLTPRWPTWSVDHTFSFFSQILLLLGLSILAGCTSTPKKTPLPPAAQAQINALRTVPLPERLPIPVKGIKAAKLTNTWGAARSQGRSHEGIDIMAERGTKVLSATMGVVVDMRNNNLGGKVIWIAGPAGSYHYYAHLDKHKRGLNVGDRVKKGQVIGYVGNTGNARGGSPHLHYGIYLSGKGRGAVNPYLYLFKS